MIKIILPFPVSINSLYGGGSGQRRFPSKRYKLWLASCPRLEPLQLNNIRLDYLYYFPDYRERDCENYVKCVSDYLVNQNVIKNDDWRSIYEMRLIPIGIDRKKARVEIDIYKRP